MPFSSIVPLCRGWNLPSKLCSNNNPLALPSVRPYNTEGPRRSQYGTLCRAFGKKMVPKQTSHLVESNVKPSVEPKSTIGPLESLSSNRKSITNGAERVERRLNLRLGFFGTQSCTLLTRR